MYKDVKDGCHLFTHDFSQKDFAKNQMKSMDENDGLS